MSSLETQNQTIFSHGIGVDKSVVEDSTKLIISTTANDAIFTNGTNNVYAGRPVTQLPTAGADQGKVVPFGVGDVGAATNVRVYGLAKSNRNTFVDETAGSFGAFGSGKMTVVQNGIVTVRANVFLNADGTTTTTVPNFVSTTYAPGQTLYVELNAGADLGKITNVLDGAGAGINGNTAFGVVTVAPTALRPEMELRLFQ